MDMVTRANQLLQSFADGQSLFHKNNQTIAANEPDAPERKTTLTWNERYQMAKKLDYYFMHGCDDEELIAVYKEKIG